jgi:hypothetical protein
MAELTLEVSISLLYAAENFNFRGLFFSIIENSRTSSSFCHSLSSQEYSHLVSYWNALLFSYSYCE